MKEGLRESLRSGAQLALAALLATGLLAGTFALTRARIADAEHRLQMDALAIVIPADRYDNDLVADSVTVSAQPWLGQPLATVHRARMRGQDAALVLSVVAPDGYSGDIGLLVAVDRDGRVLGVRVDRHRETPGLGDDIEAGRSDWITRFTGRALGDPDPARWAVRKDGGDFDQFAGATVTPRAVVLAVKRSLEFVALHGQALYAAPPGATLRIDSAPDDYRPQ
ncbi:MAG: electron transport complex subunit RsxG [Lysobacteraceae bacterium]|nr:MAG: electron transport complex subunit RsxG [Xanthomonadaceae bacterium]